MISSRTVLLPKPKPSLGPDHYMIDFRAICLVLFPETVLQETPWEWDTLHQKLPLWEKHCEYQCSVLRWRWHWCFHSLVFTSDCWESQERRITPQKKLMQNGKFRGVSKKNVENLLLALCGITLLVWPWLELYCTCVLLSLRQSFRLLPRQFLHLLGMQATPTSAPRAKRWKWVELSYSFSYVV